MHKLSLIFLLIISTTVYSQKEGNNWYFGDHAGIDFNGLNPIAVTNSQMYATEGCSSISDSNGALLFYTNGILVYNKNHTLMPNGFDLHGDGTTTQSATIVQKPGSTNLYYIFTIGYYGFVDGLQYSEVDLSLNNGLGDVTNNKNVPVLAVVTEKIAIVKHQNNLDYWVVVQDVDADKFNSYLLSANGLSSTPVISNTSFDISTTMGNRFGYLKSSPDGKRLAQAFVSADGFEIYDFDNQTGQISNPLFINNTNNGTYGIEFSPNSNLLYVGAGDLLQYNLQGSSANQIFNSKKVIGQPPYGTALQVGPDSKIYQGLKGFSKLGIVKYPNLIGLSSTYDSSGIDLMGKICRYGLPGYYNSILQPSLRTDHFCEGDTTTFEVTYPTTVDSLLWIFDDTLSGLENTSTIQNTSHLFTSPGIYNVQLISFKQNSSDTTTLGVEIFGTPNPAFGPDTFMCDGQTLILDAYHQFGNYTWQDGSSDSVFYVNQAGTYWATVESNDCIGSDTINVTYQPIPIFDLGADTSLCQTDSLLLDASTSNCTYLWQDGSYNNTFQTKSTGLYWCEADLNGCPTRDSIYVTYDSLPNPQLGNDTSFCAGESIDLNVNFLFSDYLWQDSSTYIIHTASTSGQYWVRVTNKTCVASDTINIEVIEYPEVYLGEDTLICENDSHTLSALNPGASYLWQDNSTSPNFTVTEEGQYQVLVSNGDCQTSDSIYVSFKPCSPTLKLPNVFSPNNDGVNDLFSVIESQGIKSMTSQIYNRWGTLVFETNKLNIDWNGENMNDGTYFWIVNFIGDNGEKGKMNGSLHLVR